MIEQCPVSFFCFLSFYPPNPRTSTPNPGFSKLELHILTTKTPGESFFFLSFFYRSLRSCLCMTSEDIKNKEVKVVPLLKGCGLWTLSGDFVQHFLLKH